MSKKKKKKILFHLATKLGWLLILLLGKLSFIKIVGRHHLDQLRAKKVPFIYVLWHGRMVLPIYVHRHQKITTIASLHADGEMMAQTIQRLGYRTVRGSSTRGGKEAFHNMLEALNQNGTGAMVPDGPRGPRHYLKPGTIYLAQQTGAYLLPLTFSAKRKIQFKSWDRFLIPLPFSKSVVLYGAPTHIPPNLSAEELEKRRTAFQEAMIQLEKQADEYFRK